METNNKLREALTKVKEWMEHRIATRGFEPSATFPTMLEDVVLPALAEPVKNCEVGTTIEQLKRFAEYCESEVCKRKRCKSRAKVLYIELCALKWAQMPYAEKEGGAK